VVFENLKIVDMLKVKINNEHSLPKNTVLQSAEIIEDFFDIIQNFNAWNTVIS